MKFSIGNTAPGKPSTLSLQCPHCGHFGAFLLLGQDLHVPRANGLYAFGQRRCPRPECKGHIFTVSQGTKLITSYPPRLINFDKSNIPQSIVDSFQEAILCHSNHCYKAAAIMIRKTLEEICEEQGATGKNLFQRLTDLVNKIVLPQELKEAIQELRLLGNDAAHIESRTYDEVGVEEIEVSLEFTKEILKGLYQYDLLLSRLRSLKNKNTSSNDS